MTEILKSIIENGAYVVLLAYFIFKDYRFNNSVLGVLQEIKEVLAVLKEHTKNSKED